MTALTVIGKKWFQRSFGNTYHTVRIIIDGKAVYTSGETYGYGDQYLQTATDWMEQNGLLPDIEHYSNGGTENLWRYCERKGIIFSYFASNVSRERDLKW